KFGFGRIDSERSLFARWRMTAPLLGAATRSHVRQVSPKFMAVSPCLTSISCYYLNDAAFFEIDQLTQGSNVIPRRRSAVHLALMEVRSSKIVPAEFGDKRIPDNQIAAIQTSSLFITPFQDFLVASALADAFR